MGPAPYTRPSVNGRLVVSKTTDLGSSPRGRAKVPPGIDNRQCCIQTIQLQPGLILPFSIKVIISDSGSEDARSIRATATIMNSLGHFLVSLGKSILRIGACVWAAVSKDVVVLAVGFGIAELLGILEEVVDKRS